MLEDLVRSLVSTPEKNGSSQPIPVVRWPGRPLGVPTNLDCRPPLFNGVLPGDYLKISAVARNRQFEKGEMLHMEGDAGKQVLLLTAGLVKLTKIGTSGNEVILRLCDPGEVLGVADLFFLGTHSTSAQAFRPCRVLSWDIPAFKSLVGAHPILHQNMARILGKHLFDLQDRFREVATERVGSRVAHQVVRLVEQIGRSSEGAVEIALSREELAQMTGTTLFTVSRLFSAWEALGIVKPRREAVLILNMALLRSISEAG